MYDKKTAKPLRACVPVDPFESATRGEATMAASGQEGGGRMKPITVENVCGAALDFGCLRSTVDIRL